MSQNINGKVIIGSYYEKMGVDFKNVMDLINLSDEYCDVVELADNIAKLETEIHQKEFETIKFMRAKDTGIVGSYSNNVPELKENLNKLKVEFETKKQALKEKVDRLNDNNAKQEVLSADNVNNKEEKLQNVLIDNFKSAGQDGSEVTPNTVKALQIEFDLIMKHQISVLENSEKLCEHMDDKGFEWKEDIMQAKKISYQDRIIDSVNMVAVGIENGPLFINTLRNMNKGEKDNTTTELAKVKRVFYDAIEDLFFGKISKDDLKDIRDNKQDELKKPSKTISDFIKNLMDKGKTNDKKIYIDKNFKCFRQIIDEVYEDEGIEILDNSKPINKEPINSQSKNEQGKNMQEDRAKRLPIIGQDIEHAGNAISLKGIAEQINDNRDDIRIGNINDYADKTILIGKIEEKSREDTEEQK